MKVKNHLYLVYGILASIIIGFTISIISIKNQHRDELSLFAQRSSNKIIRNKSIARLALYSAYCNNYHNRALHYYVDNKDWGKYVLMPPVCNVQDALEVLDAVKYREFVPKDKDIIYYTYDTYFTGKGYSGEHADKQHKELEKKIDKEIRELLEIKLRRQ